MKEIPSEIEKEYQEAIRQSHRRSIILVMENQGYPEVHTLDSLPCWGSLRKYAEEKEHVHLCTQPDDEKPNDLYNTFPQGTPLRVTLVEKSAGVLPVCLWDKFLFSNESPWKKGFVDESAITTGNLKDKRFFVSLKDMDFDPTVLVHLMKVRYELVMNSYSSSEVSKQLVESTLTQHQQVLYCLYFMGTRYNGVHTGYSIASKISFKRFLNQDPKDLTGGTFKDKYDYNRADLAKVFYDPEGVNMLKTEFAVALNKPLTAEREAQYKEWWAANA